MTFQDGLATAIGALDTLLIPGADFELNAGLVDADAGVVQLQCRAPQKLQAGTGLVRVGWLQLEVGLTAAVSGVLQLSDGADAAYAGSGDLADGLGQIAERLGRALGRCGPPG